MDEGNKLLYDAMRDLSRRIKDNKAEIQRLTRNVYPTKKIEPELIDDVAQQQAHQMLMDLKGQVAEQEKYLSNLSEAWKMINSGLETQALNKLKSIPADPNFPGVQGAIGKYKQAFDLHDDIMSTTTKGSDTAFIQKYLSLLRGKQSKSKLSKWLANPKNSERLEKLMQKDKIYDIVSSEKMRLPFRKKLLGLTAKDTANRLGVGVGALAGGTGLLKLYDWFSNSGNPMDLSSSTGSIYALSSQVNTSGPGLRILNSVNKSLSRMNRLASEVNSGLTDKSKAPELAQKYVEGVTEELNNINAALGQWNLVTENSTNPLESRNLGKQLQALVRQQALTITQLAQKLEVPIDISQTPDLPKYRGRNDISKIQGLIEIPKTGRIDQKTIDTLRELENIFNRRANTDVFAGKFVDSSGNIIDYYRLSKIFDIMKQYK